MVKFTALATVAALAMTQAVFAGPLAPVSQNAQPTDGLGFGALGAQTTLITAGVLIVGGAAIIANGGSSSSSSTPR